MQGLVYFVHDFRLAFFIRREMRCAVELRSEMRCAVELQFLFAEKCDAVMQALVHCTLHSQSYAVRNCIISHYFWDDLGGHGVARGP